MYAITSAGYRAISSPADIVAGETFAATLPQSLVNSMRASETARATNKAKLDNQTESELADLRAYRDNASPTTEQTTAVVKTLCRVAIALIRHRLGKLEATT